MFSSVHVSKPTRGAVSVVFSSGPLPSKSEPAVRGAAKRPGFKFEAGQIAESFGTGGQAIVVGVGAGSYCDWRNAAATLGRFASQLGLEKLKLGGAALHSTEATMVGEAFGLLAWDPVLYRGKSRRPRGAVAISLESADKGVQAALKKGLKIAECTNLARALVQTPPNVATPDEMAARAKEVAAASGLKFSVMKGKKLVEERLTGLINVGQASVHPPCLIRLEYCPKGREKDRPIVLLGKTVTYDTGGLSLKDRNGMRGMKADKAGGCAVLGAMQAIAKVHKPGARVVGLLVAAENCVSDEAYRPDDVITFRNGVTVEVTNTDAEGRLVLADGLCWACEVEKARCIVDIATLTGGVVRALGTVYAGLFANNEALCESLVMSGNATDEMLWRLPLHARYQEMMRSQVADIVNSNMSGMAHPVQGATFLEYFVAKGTPWAHIDMAGHATVERDSGPLVAGPTGFGVRLLSEFVKGMA
jgi:leucyl aminopeptidase